MLTDMDKLLRNNSGLDEVIVQSAAAYMMSHQFIYRFEGEDRKHYIIISEHRDYYRKLFSALGYDLVIDDIYTFAGLIPEHTFRQMKVMDTIFLLLARIFFDDKMKDMLVTSNYVTVSYDEFADRIEQLTGRRIEKKSHMNDFFDSIQRFHVTRKSISDTGVHVVNIYPGIMSLISPEITKRIELFNREKFTAAAREIENETA